MKVRGIDNVGMGNGMSGEEKCLKQDKIFINFVFFSSIL